MADMKAIEWEESSKRLTDWISESRKIRVSRNSKIYIDLVSMYQTDSQFSEL